MQAVGIAGTEDHESGLFAADPGNSGRAGGADGHDGTESRSQQAGQRMATDRVGSDQQDRRMAGGVFGRVVACHREVTMTLLPAPLYRGKPYRGIP